MVILATTLVVIIGSQGRGVDPAYSKSSDRPNIVLIMADDK
jgi:hypothetical protein